MISDEIRELYNKGGKHQFLVCERCNQEVYLEHGKGYVSIV